MGILSFAVDAAPDQARLTCQNALVQIQMLVGYLHEAVRRVSGLHKMDFLVTEAGDGAVNMMRTIKRALDPQNIMNPGKIFTL